MKAKNVKKVLAITAAAAMAGIMLGGCGNSGSDDTSETEKAETGASEDPGTSDTEKNDPEEDAASKDSAESSDKEVVTAWMGSWWEDEIPRIEKGFEEEYPQYDLQVECLPINNYIETAVSAILGGNAPDALALDTLMLGTPIGQGLLQPMDDFMKEYEWSADDFSEGVMNAGVQDGVTYAVPYRTGPTALFYNKTLFDAAGIDYPTDNMPYEQFFEVCKKLTDKDKGVYGFGIAATKNDPANCMSSFGMFFGSTGGAILNEDNSEVTIDSPESVKGIQQWVDLYTEGVVPEGCINYAWSADLYPMAQNGQLAMIPMDPVTASSIDEYAQANGFEYGFCVNPGSTDRVGGWHWTIPTGIKNPEGAKAFIDYFLTPEVLSAQDIVQPAVIESQSMGAWGEERYEVYWKADANATYVLPVVPEYTEIQNIIITELQNILQGKEDVENGCSVMADNIKALRSEWQ